MRAKYLFSVVAAALAVSLVSVLPQSKGIRRISSLLGGLIVLLALLRPVLRLRIGNLEHYLDRYQADCASVNAVVRAGEKESARLITEQTRAYILDKAGALGIEVEPQIELAALSEHYRYPYRVTLRGSWTAQSRQELSQYISQTLGIPEERQIWQED